MATGGLEISACHLSPGDEAEVAGNQFVLEGDQDERRRVAVFDRLAGQVTKQATPTVQPFGIERTGAPKFARGGNRGAIPARGQSRFGFAQDEPLLAREPGCSELV